MTVIDPLDIGTQDPADLADRGAPSDNDSLTEVLRRIATQGFAASLRPAAGAVALVCGRCGATTAASEVPVAFERRLEGASDPDDSVLAVAARCPACGVGGVVVLGYGPGASPEDSDIVAALETPDGSGSDDDRPADDGDAAGAGSGDDEQVAERGGAPLEELEGFEAP